MRGMSSENFTWKSAHTCSKSFFLLRFSVRILFISVQVGGQYLFARLSYIYLKKSHFAVLGPKSWTTEFTVTKIALEVQKRRNQKLKNFHVPLSSVQLKQHLNLEQGCFGILRNQNTRSGAEKKDNTENNRCVDSPLEVKFNPLLILNSWIDDAICYVHDFDCRKCGICIWAKTDTTTDRHNQLSRSHVLPHF